MILDTSYWINRLSLSYIIHFWCHVNICGGLEVVVLFKFVCSVLFFAKKCGKISGVHNYIRSIFKFVAKFAV